MTVLSVAGSEQRDQDQDTFVTLNHPAFQSLKVETCQSLSAEGRVTSSVQTVLTCTKLITGQTISQVIRFLYTGSLEEGEEIINITALKQASQYIHIVITTNTKEIRKKSYFWTPP